MTQFDRRQVGSLLLSTGALLSLAGCTSLASAISAAPGAVASGASVASGAVAVAASSVAVASGVVASLAVDPTTAANIWATVKGIAQVALTTAGILDPSAVVAINLGVAAADEAVKLLPTVDSDLAATASHVSTIMANASSVLLAAAPAITAVANT